jgi:hypothetical protein
MWRKTLVVLAAVVGVLAITGTASAGGWAGSRYAKSDCTYDRGSDTLFCQAWFTSEEQVTEQFAAPDSTCPSTLRFFVRTGTRVTTFRGWGLFAGRTPVGHKELAGDEDGFEISWRDVHDTALDCVP